MKPAPHQTTGKLQPAPDEISGGFNPHVAGIDYGALDEHVGYALRRAQIKVYEDFLATLAPWQITPPRFSALTLIARNPGMKQTELANLLGIARSGVVMLTDGLAALGLVARIPSASDRRVYLLELTENGKNTMLDIEAAVSTHDERISSRLSAAEKAQLLGLLAKLG